MFRQPARRETADLFGLDAMNFYVLLERLAPIQGMPTAWIVIVAAFLAVNSRDLRLAILMLGLQYLFSGLLFAGVLDLRLAVAFVIGGLFVFMILAVTTWQIQWGKLTPNPDGHSLPAKGLDSALRLGPLSFPRRTWLRILLSLVAVGVAFTLSRPTVGFSAGALEAQPYLRFAIYGLGSLGLVGLVTATEPLPAGIGLLLFINGFSLFFSTLNPSNTMLVLLIALQLLVAVVVAYLAQARRVPAKI